jgi:beta-glucosidase
VIVNVEVTNDGTLEGDEISQLYLHHNVSSVEVPDRALKGFLRIHLNPGETRKVTFHLKQRDLAVWNIRRMWVVEPGPYTVFAGGSSEASLSAKFTIATTDHSGK